MVDIPRKSKYPMVEIESARLQVTQKLSALPSETVPLSRALHRVLAETITAPRPVPYFRASIKDGYAVRFAESDGPDERRVVGRVSAGDETTAGAAVGEGEVAYITTGAALPAGTDTVVMAEDTAAAGAGSIRVLRWPARAGQDVRAVGSDMRQGEPVVRGGAVVGAAEVGLLAACGVRDVAVVRRPRVGVMSTGDEVVDVADAAAARDGQIVDCNRPMLLAAVREFLPFADGVDLGVVADDAPRTRAALLAADCDVLVCSGGVSMGARDVVQRVLEDVATVHFGRVRMKPGKPLTFATRDGGGGGPRCFLGLPGNPVSALVCFHLGVCAAARTLGGWAARDALGPRVQARLAHALPLDAVRPEFHRAVLAWRDGAYVAASTGRQDSSRLLSARAANALLCLPAGDAPLEAGAVVDAMLLAAAPGVGGAPAEV